LEAQVLLVTENDALKQKIIEVLCLNSLLLNTLGKAISSRTCSINWNWCFP